MAANWQQYQIGLRKSTTEGRLSGNEGKHAGNDLFNCQMFVIVETSNSISGLNCYMVIQTFVKIWAIWQMNFGRHMSVVCY